MTATREARIPLSPQLAAEIFTEVWQDTMLLGEIATQLTCTEFEALADVLLAFGADPGLVEEFEDIHARGDEPGDDHYLGEV